MSKKTSSGQSQRRPVSALARWQIREYRVLDLLSELLHWVEVALAAISVAFVAVGVLYLLAELLHFREAIEQSNLHTSYEELLSDILLLVVGVELALMLVRRTPDALIEVMFFVVARKMLIKADSFWDLVLGVAALAGLFAIRKYLEHVPKHLEHAKDHDHENNELRGQAEVSEQM
jgi:cell division protein FtsW (lipid II flippase)